MKAQKNSFVMLGAYLRGQLLAPVRHVSFWVYLIIAIFVAGALGIYVELFKFMNGASDLGGLLTAIYTYFPAIAAGAGLQMMLAEREKYVRSFAIIASTLLVLLTLLHAFKVYGKPQVSLVFGIVGIVSSTLFWWIANGGNQSFQDFDLEAPLGGAAEAEPQGDTSEYKV